MNQTKWQEEFRLHFGTDTSRIGVRALASSLIAVNVAIEQIKQGMGTGTEVALRVKPFEEGSFEVPFELIEMCVAGMLAVNVTSIPDIIKYLREYIQIKKELRGYPPEKVERRDDKYEITSHGGSVTVIESVTHLTLNNPVVNDAFSEAAQSIGKDPSISKFELANADGQAIVTTTRAELDYFAPTPERDAQAPSEGTVRTELNLHKVVFDDRSKWGFIWRGNKINARIVDDAFVGTMHGGRRFANGDVLEVDLKIHKAYDKVADTSVNKSYEITKVHRHIPRPEQTALGL